MQCRLCQKELEGDEIAIYRKLVNKLAPDFLCIDCLAADFGCSREAIEQRIKYYRDSGTCSLFR